MTNTATAAARYVQLYHMCDWIWADEMRELAARLGLSSDSYQAYLDARQLAGMS